MRETHPYFVDIFYKKWAGVLAVPSAYEYGAQEPLRKHSFFEQDMLEDIEKELGEGKVFLDVGAGFGNHLLFLGGFLKAKEIIACEVGPFQQWLIGGTLLYNNIKNVKLIGTPIGNVQEKVKFKNLHPLSLGKTCVMPLTKEEEEEGIASLEAQPFDTIWKKDLKSIHIDCVKIDIEDYTVKALLGMKELIKECKPVLYIEIPHIEADRAMLTKTMQELKYARIERFGTIKENASLKFKPME